MEDPRITAYKQAALKMGHSPQDIDAYVNAVILPKIQTSQQNLLQEKLSTQKTTLDLQNSLKTPAERAQEKAQEEIALQDAYARAGLDPAGKKPDTTLSKEDKKNQEAAGRVTSIIASLAEGYNNIPSESRGAVGGRKSQFMAAIGQDDPGANKAAAYEAARLGLAASIKEATGDTGILTDPDRKYLAGLLPKTTDNEGLAKERMGLLNTFLIDKYGKGLPEKTLTMYGLKGGSDKKETPPSPLNTVLNPQQSQMQTQPQPQNGGLNVPLDQNGKPLLQSGMVAGSVPQATAPNQQHSVGEAMRALIGTPKARDKFMNDFAQMLQLKGDMYGNKNNRKDIPVLDQVLSLSSGMAKGVGEGPIQIVGGLSTGNKYDIGMGAAKTGLEVLGGGKMKPASTAVSMGLGGLLSAIQGKDALQGAGEGIAGAAQFEGLSSLLGPVTNKYVHPRATIAASKSKAAKEATKEGIEFSLSKEQKDAAKYILGKKEFLEPAQKEILKKLANSKVLTPEEVTKAQPILREMGRSLTNNALRSGEGQAFNYLYESLVNQSKDLVPKMYKETVNYAKTFPKQTKNLEPLQRLLHTGTGKVGAAATTAGLVYLLNKMGLGRGGSDQ